MGGEVSKSKEHQWPHPKRPQLEEKHESMSLWTIFVYGLVGATVTTFAYTRLQGSSRGGTGSSFRTAFQEEARKRYDQRMREAYEEEMERVERIKRMQNVFNRARNKRKGYETWKENETGGYNQHFQRDDWYWKTDQFFRDHSYQHANFRRKAREAASYPLSNHYSVLGLDRTRAAAYTEAEIKTAFRAKAKEFHPDQNQDKKEAAEEKFKEVMLSYEAIKQERKDMKL